MDKQDKELNVIVNQYGIIECIDNKCGSSSNFTAFVGKSYNEVFKKTHLFGLDIDIKDIVRLDWKSRNNDIECKRHYIVVVNNCDHGIVKYKLINIDEILYTAEIVIKAKTHELESIIDMIPGILYWKDGRGTYIKTNNSILAGGIKVKDLLGKNDKEIWSEKAEELSQHDNQIMMGIVEEKVLEESTVENGEIKYYIAHKKPYKDHNNKIIGIIGLSIDITERKKLEAETIRQKINLKKS